MLSTMGGLSGLALTTLWSVSLEVNLPSCRLVVTLTEVLGEAVWGGRVCARVRTVPLGLCQGFTPECRSVQNQAGYNGRCDVLQLAPRFQARPPAGGRRVVAGCGGSRNPLGCGFFRAARLYLGAVRSAPRGRQPGIPFRGGSGHLGGPAAAPRHDGGRSRGPGPGSSPSDSLGRLRVGRHQHVPSRGRRRFRRLPGLLCGRREGVHSVQGSADRRSGPGVQRELGGGTRRLGGQPSQSSYGWASRSWRVGYCSF